MSQIGPAITQYLLGQSSVTDLIGNNITPKLAEREETYPQVIYELRDVERHGGFDGFHGLTTCNVVFTIVDKTYESIDNISDAMTAVLDYQSGVWDGVTVQGSFLTPDTTDDQYIDPESRETVYFLRSITFQVSYES